MLCNYSNIFGEPNTGLHSIRIFNIAIIDVLLTVIFAFIISYYTEINFFLIFIILFIIGELLHLLFCVKTTVIKLFI